MRPGFASHTQRYMWVEFVVGSLLFYERFFSGYCGFPLSPQKPAFPNSNAILKCTDTSERILMNPLVLTGKQIAYLIFFTYADI